MRVSLALPGFNAQDATPQNLVLDSRYPSPKIDAFASPPHSGIITVNNRVAYTPPTRGNVQTIYSFLHGYDHIPTVVGNFRAVNDVGDVFGGALPEIVDDGVNSLFVFSISSDLNRVSVNFLGTQASPSSILPFTIQIRFYVMAERGYQ